MKDNVYELVITTKGIDLFGIQGSGVLTGDLGKSMSINRGRPVTGLFDHQHVTDLFGKGLWEFMLLMPLTLFAAMAFVFVQRRRRLPILALPSYPQSRNLLPQYAHPMRVPGL